MRKVRAGKDNNADVHMYKKIGEKSVGCKN